MGDFRFPHQPAGMVSPRLLLSAGAVLLIVHYSCASTSCTKTVNGVTKMCMKITPANIFVNGTTPATGACMWTNLARQTPDATATWNAPNVNNFASVYDKTTGTKDYYGFVETNGTKEAKQANDYWVAFNKALSRYNCEEQYSHWNCDDCRKAYARWACAMTIPQCTESASKSGGTCATSASIKPCVRVCNEVVQRCPVTLGFTCPDDNRDYGDSSCNLMGLTAGASTVSTSLVSAVALGLAVVAFARD